MSVSDVKCAHSGVAVMFLAPRFFAAGWLSLVLVFLMAGAARGQFLATSQTVTPPAYPGMTVPFMETYLLYPQHWAALDGTNPPNPPVTRTVNGVNWFQVETARGTFTPNDDNLNFSGTQCSGNNWLPNANCYNKNPTLNGKKQGNLMYTFNTVPGWASFSGSLSYANINCSGSNCAVSLTINAGGTTLVGSSSCPSGVADTMIVAATDTHTSEVNGTVTLCSVSGSGSSTVITFNEPSSYYSGGNLVTRTSYTGSATGVVTYTTNHAPSDIYSGSETCNYPNATTQPSAPYGDCYFKEFVVHLMEDNCNLTPGSGIPANPSSGTCTIHYFEGWNEFNSDTFWQSNYTELARMMVDADVIIHEFCSDCYFMAGSVSAGGDGYHQFAETNGKDSSAVYIEAIGQLLEDWHTQAADTTRIDSRFVGIQPDMISFHPYPGHDNIYQPAMPETSIPVGTTLVGGAANTDPSCAAGYVSPLVKFVPNTQTWVEPAGQACRDSVISAIEAMANPSYGIIAQLNSAMGATWFPTSTPVWDTESGWGKNVEVDFGTATANSLTDPDDNSLTTFFSQSYLARYAILTAASRDKFNLWYQSDDSTWGTYLDYASAWLADHVYAVGDQAWDGNNVQQVTVAATTGKSGSTTPSWSATKGGTTTDGQLTWENVYANAGTTLQTPFVNRVAATLGVVHGWLTNVSSFSGTLPSTGWAKNTYYALNTTISDGNMVQRVVHAGTSNDTSAPAWNETMYGQTTDGSSLVWETMGTAKCTDTSQFGSDGKIDTPAVWSCPVAENGGHAGEIVWYVPFDKSYTYTAPAGTTCLWDIDGNEKPRLGGAELTVYNRPVLLDNRTDSVCTGH